MTKVTKPIVGRASYTPSNMQSGTIPMIYLNNPELAVPRCLESRSFGPRSPRIRFPTAEERAETEILGRAKAETIEDFSPHPYGVIANGLVYPAKVRFAGQEQKEGHVVSGVIAIYSHVDLEVNEGVYENSLVLFRNGRIWQFLEGEEGSNLLRHLIYGNTSTTEGHKKRIEGILSAYQSQEASAELTIQDRIRRAEYKARLHAEESTFGTFGRPR